MKTALLRILTIATLATGLAASAADALQSNQATTDETAMAAANTQQAGCPADSSNENKQKKAKSHGDNRTEQEKEFDRTLMGYFG